MARGLASPSPNPLPRGEGFYHALVGLPLPRAGEGGGEGFCMSSSFRDFRHYSSLRILTMRRITTTPIIIAIINISALTAANG